LVVVHEGPKSLNYADNQPPAKYDLDNRWQVSTNYCSGCYAKGTDSDCDFPIEVIDRTKNRIILFACDAVGEFGPWRWRHSLWQGLVLDRLRRL
jgi:hypothetical protein